MNTLYNDYQYDFKDYHNNVGEYRQVLCRHMIPDLVRVVLNYCKNSNDFFRSFCSKSLMDNTRYLQRASAKDCGVFPSSLQTDQINGAQYGPFKTQLE